MSAYNLPDYWSEYFEYKKLHKIHGQTTLESLVILFQQLKRNAQKLQTTLGGGQLEYLALILPPATHNTIPNSTLFVRQQIQIFLVLQRPQVLWSVQDQEL